MQSTRQTLALFLVLASGCTTPPAPEILAPPTSPDTASVTIDSVWREGDQVAIAYSVTLGRMWEGEMLSLAIEPGVPLTQVSSAPPARWLDRKATYDGRDVVQWMALGRVDRPTTGSTTAEFVIRARAVLGAVPFLVQRYHAPLLTSEDQLGDSIAIPTFWEQGFGGMVLGPAGPVRASAADRGTQLVSDVTEWCAASSSVPRGICESLARNAGEVRDASGSDLDRVTRVFRSELDAQRGKHVPDAVYWRLVADLLMVAP
jgi:hypothetical protein